MFLRTSPCTRCELGRLADGTALADAGWTMLRLNSEQRRVLADQVFDVAHLAIGALVFGQIFGRGPFSAALAFTGLALWAALLCLVLWMTKEGPS